MVEEPGDGRWDGDSGLNWRQIADAVADAVQFAQRSLTDPMSDQSEVEIEALPDRERYVVEEWLAHDLPEFSPSGPQVHNGRHRTWLAREAGANEAPVLNAAVGDAIRHWHDAALDFGLVDLELLDSWRSERYWWNSDDAINWAIRNRIHLRHWDEALDLWSGRLGV